MDLSDSTTQYTLIVSILALLAAYFLVQPTSLVKWLQKKNYQYEVTFSLYMLTPTEKFVFSTFVHPIHLTPFSPPSPFPDLRRRRRRKFSHTCMLT